MSDWNLVMHFKVSVIRRVRRVRADPVEFQHLSEKKGTTWGQAVTADGKEKDDTSEEQGDILTFVL